MIRQFLLMLLNGVPSEEVHQVAVDLASAGAHVGPSSASLQRELTAAKLHHICFNHASDSRRKALVCAMVRTTKRTVQLWESGDNEQAQARAERGAQA